MNKIFIANVATDFTNEEMTDLMAPFGTIISVKVVANKKEGNLSFAFVEFEEEISARNAIKYFGEHLVVIDEGDSPLVVKEARERKERTRINVGSRRSYNERRSFDGDYRRRY